MIFCGKLWIPIYILTILSLVGVLFTTPIYGATSWFQFGSVSIQPGEIAKITLILGLGKLLDFFKQKGKLNHPLYVLVVLIYVAIPCALLALQPDYGTAMVFLVVAAVMIYISGIHVGYIMGAIVTVTVGVVMAYNYLLPDYAKNRINVFLNPGSDPSGAGYNIIQSELAVGSGQMWGMGLFNGNQTQLRLSANENDRLHLRSHFGRNGICGIDTCCRFVCVIDCEEHLYCQNGQG